MKLKLAISPCPNDTFIFDALINQKIKNIPFELEVILADIEELNSLAMQGQVDICKISYNAYPSMIDDYQLLTAGSALGRKCGPILLAKKKIDTDKIPQCRVAIPGLQTTANFLLSYAYPQITKKTPVIFSDIEDVVLNEEYDLGLIIHENRFTYESKGLIKIKDLGEYWEATTGYPIPLGGIVVKRDLPSPTKAAINNLVQKSVRFAFANPNASSTFVRQHAQEMDAEVTQKHIALYVNHFTEELGKEGKAAVNRLFKEKAKISKKTIDLDTIFIS